MNEARAKQIMESLGVIDVRCNGTPIWIESINGNKAEVTDLKSKEKMEVSLDRLVEG